MIVHDAIYGRFELPAFLDPLLSAPEFRRLAEVRLININSPALSSLGDVRRHSHTLGVLRLAMANPLIDFGEDEHRALLASIIVHDAGTPAFAHLFEYQLMEKFNWNHEKVVSKIMLKEHHVDGSSHQFFASRRPQFERLCRSAKIDFSIVLSILEMRHRGAGLIFGTLDFDNLDNVARMYWMLGGRFNVDSIISLASSIAVDGNSRLVLPESQKDNLVEWARLRREAYEILVFDGPTVAGQAVLSQLIADALHRNILSNEDWHYNDHELLAVLGSTPHGRDTLERDFFGSLPDLQLIVQVFDRTDLLFSKSNREIVELVQQFLMESKITRPYGYSLKDRGTFEKEVTAIDPKSGKSWSVGARSDSLVIYGFGRGGGRARSAAQAGQDFLTWINKTA